MVLQFGSDSSPTCKNPGRDPRRWLEDVEGAAQLDWVKAKNAEAISILGDPKASPVYDRILSILDSKQKIPFVGRVLNGKYYNFWQDETHVRGIWRRCSPEEYRKETISWEIVLDLDVLSKQEEVASSFAPRCSPASLLTPPLPSARCSLLHG